MQYLLSVNDESVAPAVPRDPCAAGASTGRTNRESIVALKKMMFGCLSFSMANMALAGGVVVPLGTPLGIALGDALGTALGLQLGTALPIAGGGLLTVAAVSLVLGIRMVRRKQNR